ncbi:major facilitator superfamily protein [Salinisphaera dokdonensis CL-ES53]|uniref:Major facilitator superfamily protein n=1 Tax=Salinisphaera dokdonensis CL-ES53 TaxID=1304272 RepID=A0ABV2AXL0_9GAMM
MSSYRDGIRLGVAGAAAAACIYFPQPLAAQIQTTFDVSVLWSAMPMTFAFIVLTSGPVLFGRFITVGRAMRIVLVTELLLAALFAMQAIAFAAVPYFLLRALQVMLLPLLIPAVITGSSNIQGSESRARDLALYTAGTIVGGVTGRLLAVGSVAFEHWQLGSLAITAMLLFSAWLLRKPPTLASELRRRSSPTATGTASAPERSKSWRTPVSLSFPGLALAFGVLTTVLTCLPFEIGYERGGTLMLAIVYGGYAVGIATSLGAPGITRVSRGLPNATLTAAVLFVVGLCGVIQGSFPALVIGVVLLCGSMVFHQATQIVLLNDYFARSQSGTVSALFVAAVFAGGTLGSSVMLSLYEWQGWGAVMTVCLLFSLIAGYCVYAAARRQAQAAQTEG